MQPDVTPFPGVPPGVPKKYGRRLRDPAPDCAYDVHVWDEIRAGGAIVAAKCLRCGCVDPLPEPFIGEVHAVHRQLATT